MRTMRLMKVDSDVSGSARGAAAAAAAVAAAASTHSDTRQTGRRTGELTGRQQAGQVAARSAMNLSGCRRPAAAVAWTHEIKLHIAWLAADRDDDVARR